MPGRQGPRGNEGRSLRRPRDPFGARDAFEHVVTGLEVERRAAFRELRGDGLTVRDRAIRTEFQLRANIGHRQTDAADARQQLAVAALPRFDRRVLALGLGGTELTLEGRSDTRWGADHL